jgi:hypothetical protein
VGSTAERDLPLEMRGHVKNQVASFAIGMGGAGGDYRYREEVASGPPAPILAVE